MTQDEIIEMARKIAIEASKAGPYRTWTHEHAMSLIMQLVDASAAKEREACAKMVEANADACVTHGVAQMCLYSNASAIRARGET